MQAEPDNTAKAVLQPRRPGESIKVAETVLKRRDRNLKAAADRAAQIARIRKNQKEYKKGKLKIVRAEKMVKNSLIKIDDQRRLRNMSKKKQPRLIKQARVLAVVRNGRPGGSKEAKIALRTLGLTKKHHLLFASNSKETLTKLNACKPFVFWGPVSFKLVFNIVHKNALFRSPDEPTVKTVLSDNVLIEKHLGDLGVLCTEDLAHVIHTCSDNFEKVVARLWPVPVGDAKKSSGMVNEKSFTCGDLQAAINLKVAKLLGE